jgi:hypothetical protein
MFNKLKQQATYGPEARQLITSVLADYDPVLRVRDS